MSDTTNTYPQLDAELARLRDLRDETPDPDARNEISEAIVEVKMQMQRALRWIGRTVQGIMITPKGTVEQVDVDAGDLHESITRTLGATLANFFDADTVQVYSDARGWERGLHPNKEATRWLHDNTPHTIDVVGDVVLVAAPAADGTRPDLLLVTDPEEGWGMEIVDAPAE